MNISGLLIDDCQNISEILRFKLLEYSQHSGQWWVRSRWEEFVGAAQVEGFDQEE